jgi:hypothetical protein
VNLGARSHPRGLLLSSSIHRGRKPGQQRFDDFLKIRMLEGRTEGLSAGFLISYFGIFSPILKMLLSHTSLLLSNCLVSSSEISYCKIES